MSFILTFDIPRNEPLVELRINRELKKIGAKRLQFSVWRSDKLEKLIEIALLIRSSGGQAKY